MPLPKKKPQPAPQRKPPQPAPKAVAAPPSPLAESLSPYTQDKPTGRTGSVQPNQANVSKPEPKGPYGFAADPKTLELVRIHCNQLDEDGITLRMALGCVNHLLNEAERKP